jgi:hypothetical protein
LPNCPRRRGDIIQGARRSGQLRSTAHRWPNGNDDDQDNNSDFRFRDDAREERNAGYDQCTAAHHHDSNRAAQQTKPKPESQIFPGDRHRKIQALAEPVA